jgi:hypothetical protein
MQSALEAIHEYYKSFSTLDMSAIAPHYLEPSMMVAPQGAISSANGVALAAALAPLIDSLRARGYQRSEFVDPSITILGEADSLVRGVAVRHTASGAELERVSLAYLMHRTKAGWKIAVLVVEQ